MYNYFGSEAVSLINLRTILIFVSSLKGFVRFSEVVKPRHCDVIINKTFLSIFVEKSKIDVYRE